MSEEDKDPLDKLTGALQEAQRKLYERKAKLGEPIIIADDDGMPVEISAREALRLFYGQELPPVKIFPSLSLPENMKTGDKIVDAIREGQVRLYEKKARLGETVIIADDDGMPVEISGREALRVVFGLEWPEKTKQD